MGPNTREYATFCTSSVQHTVSQIGRQTIAYRESGGGVNARQTPEALATIANNSNNNKQRSIYGLHTPPLPQPVATHSKVNKFESNHKGFYCYHYVLSCYVACECVQIRDSYKHTYLFIYILVYIQTSKHFDVPSG